MNKNIRLLKDLENEIYTYIIEINTMRSINLYCTDKVVTKMLRWIQL